MTTKNPLSPERWAYLKSLHPSHGKWLFQVGKDGNNYNVGQNKHKRLKKALGLSVKGYLKHLKNIRDGNTLGDNLLKSVQEMDEIVKAQQKDI